MSEVWPLDAKRRLTPNSGDNIGTFRCLMLMPFESRFNQVAELIKASVEKIVKELAKNYGMPALNIERLDWVDSSGAIQQQIWERIFEADLIFCDITGFNPNVMFELGVCAAWKDMNKIVMIKDHYYKQGSAFDIAPIRYTEYSLTTEGVERFKEKIENITFMAYISYPDRQGSIPSISDNINLDFTDNRDSDYIYTPPLAHRRVKDGTLEIGSVISYAHSWATIGGPNHGYFDLRFSAKFIDPLRPEIYEKPEWKPEESFIAVGVRSHHFYAGFGHIVCLGKNGSIWLSQPAEDFGGYKDIGIRGETAIDPYDYHEFHISIDKERFLIKIDQEEKVFQLSELPKLCGPGYIRFQSLRSWIGIQRINMLLKNDT